MDWGSAILIIVDVVVLPDVDHLESFVLEFLTQLHQGVLQLVLLRLDEKVSPPAHREIQLKE